MFERLFQRPFALNRHLNGPLAEERRRFLCYRADQGIGRTGLCVLASYLLACTHYLRLGDRPGEVIPYAEVEEQATLWANRRPRPHDTQPPRSSRGEFLRHTCAWLRFLGRLQPPATPRSPFADQIATFADFLLRDKGLSPKKVRGRCDLVRGFLDRLAANHVPLHDMTLSQIDQALVEQLTDGGYARVTIQGLACDLRSFSHMRSRTAGAAPAWPPASKGHGFIHKSPSQPAPRGTTS